MAKIANIVEDARIAGPQLRILAVAQILQNRGIHTTVVHPIQDSSQLTERLNEAKVDHIPIKLHRLSRGLWGIIQYGIFFIPDILTLRRIFKQQEFEFVHCNSYWQIKGIIAARLARRPAIWHLNDTCMPVRLHFFFRLACRLFVSRIIVAGSRVRQYYFRSGKIDLPTIEIQAPVDCQAFDPAKAVADPRIANRSGLKIVTVANLNPNKGIKYFLLMAELLSERFNDLSFHVVGPILTTQAQYFSQLNELIKKKGLHNVKFHGASANIPAVLKAADVYVCSSLSEASPTAVWEAMAMEKAIVSTDVGDVSRFVTHHESGLMVPIKDPKAMADAVAEFVLDPNLRLSCGRAARKIAERMLDLKACAAMHEHAYSHHGTALSPGQLHTLSEEI